MLYRNTYYDTTKNKKKLSFVRKASIGHQEEETKVENNFVWFSMEKQHYEITYPCTREYDGKNEPQCNKNGKRKKKKKVIKEHL